MMTKPDLEKIVRACTYKPDWSLLLRYDGERPYLQVEFFGPDVDDPEGEYMWQKCRKWMLSPHMTVSEVVRTAFLAFEQAERHELAEWFRYKGRPIFNPHFNVENLAELADNEYAYDVREDGSSFVEAK